MEIFMKKKTKSKLRHFNFILPFVLFVLFLILPACHSDTENNSETDEKTTGYGIQEISPGMVKINDRDVVVGVNDISEDELWAVFGDPYTHESLGIMVERDADGNPIRPIGGVYRAEDETGFKVSLDDDYLPETVSLSNGAEIKFVNYSINQVDVDIYDDQGTLLLQDTVKLGVYFDRLIESVNELQQLPDKPIGIFSINNIASINGVSAIEQEASTLSYSRGRMFIKIVSAAVAVAGCAASIPACMATTAAPPLAVGACSLAALACGSAVHGLVSAVAYYMGDEEASSASGLFSSAFGLAGCIGAAANPVPIQLLDCLGTIIDGIVEKVDEVSDYFSDCEPTEKEIELKCYAQSIFYHDDCGNPTGLVEICPSGCSDASGAAKCIQCNGIDVQIIADQTCIEKGDNIFFSSVFEQSSRDSYSYRWNFGNGHTSHLDADTSRYDNTGQYTITLEVIDDASQFQCGMASQVIRVGDCEELDVQINADPECGFINSETTFTSLIEGGASDVNDYLYSWDLGNDDVGENQTVGTIYTEAGTYLVNLAVKADNEQTGEATLQYIVGECIGVTINTDDAQPEVDQEVTLSATIDDPRTGINYNYAWNLGDGKISQEESPRVSWASAGFKNISLEVSDKDGNTGNGTLELEVGSQETIDLSTFILANICFENLYRVVDHSVDGLLDKSNMICVMDIDGSFVGNKFIGSWNTENENTGSTSIGSVSIELSPDANTITNFEYQLDVNTPDLINIKHYAGGNIPFVEDGPCTGCRSYSLVGTEVCDENNLSTFVQNYTNTDALDGYTTSVQSWSCDETSNTYLRIRPY
jgi:chitodextrinase